MVSLRRHARARRPPTNSLAPPATRLLAARGSCREPSAFGSRSAARFRVLSVFSSIFPRHAPVREGVDLVSPLTSHCIAIEFTPPRRPPLAASSMAHGQDGFEEGMPTYTEVKKSAAYASRLSRAKSANWLKFGSSLGPRAAAAPRDVDRLAYSANMALERNEFPCRVVASSFDGQLGMYATRDIAAGQRVLIERPLVLTPTPDARPFTCATCFADSRARHPRLPNELPKRWHRRCAGCKVLRFCSDTCEKRLEPRHRGCAPFSECAALAAIACEELASQRPIIEPLAGNMVAQALRLLADRHAAVRVHDLRGPCMHVLTMAPSSHRYAWRLCVGSTSRSQTLRHAS